MDLAKIRKKSLLSPKEYGYERTTSPEHSPVCTETTIEAVPAVSAFSEGDFFQNKSLSLQDFSTPTASAPSVWISPDRVVQSFTPLEVIFAGRKAAGCDDESILTDEISQESIFETSVEFLCFRVSNEIYGINIMDIKEIIKPREVTEVPRVPAFVSGIISLRGTMHSRTLAVRKSMAF